MKQLLPREGLGRWKRLLGAHREPATSVPTRHPVILIVDDEPLVRKVVRRILTAGTTALLEAADAPEAIAACRRQAGAIDLLVTDLQMPGMNGQTLVELLHPAQPSMKVLFLSGFSGMLFEERKVLPDWAAYLDKPIVPEELLEAVSLLLYGSLHVFGKSPSGDAAVA